MLVLKRRVEETVHLGDITTGRYPIVVRVLEIHENTVKLGFEAPPEINIVRSELLTPEVAQASPLPWRSAS